MGKRIPSIEAYIKEHDLMIELEEAYNGERVYFETLADHRQQHGQINVPLKKSLIVLGAMREVLPRIDATVDMNRLKVQALIEDPRISKLKVLWIHKAITMAGIMTAVSEAVAEVIWEHQHGESIVDSFEIASRATEEDVDMVNEQWKKIYRQAGREFGVIE